MPRYEDIDWRGLNFSREQFDELMSVDRAAWMKEILWHEELFIKLYDRLPKELLFVRDLLLSACGARPTTGTCPCEPTWRRGALMPGSRMGSRL